NHPGDPGIHLRTHEEAAYRPGTVHGTLAPSSYQVMQVQPCQRPEASHKRGSPKRGKKEKPGSRPLSEGGRLAHGGRVLRRRNRLSGYDPISQDRYCLTSRTGHVDHAPADSLIAITLSDDDRPNGYDEHALVAADQHGCAGRGMTVHI